MSTTPQEEMDDQTLTPSLPYEIIARVIYHLRDHKRTLASCMRVSIAVNTITVPRLYGQPVVLSHHNPFTIPINTVAGARITSSKKENLRLVKEVIIDERKEDEVPYMEFDPWAEPYATDVCRIHYQPENEVQEHLFYGIISPRKLVLRFQEDVFEDHYPVRWPLSSIVYVMEDRWSSICPRGVKCRLPGFNTKPAGAVYILWTDNPSNKFRCETHSETNNDGDTYYRETTLRPMSAMMEGDILSQTNCAHDIPHASIHENHPNDIIIVNAGQIDPAHLPSPNTALDNESVQTEFEKLVLTHFAVGKRNIVTKKVSYHGKQKSREELEKTKFTFVSLQEYIAKYDWSGELTEEEVDPWRKSKVVEELDDYLIG